MILDCTMRDGGFYNNWNFSKKFIRSYINLMEKIHVDVVELGYRSLNIDPTKGKLANITEKYIKSLIKNSKLKLAVMIDGKDIFNAPKYKLSINKLFPKKANKSRISIVRIACNLHEIKKVILASKLLKNKGYDVWINFMQINFRTKNDILKFIQMSKKAKISTIYIADSMGSLNPRNVEKIIKLIRKNWEGDIGIHAHDNMNNALKNSLKAFRSGANLADSSVMGMGRGAGNTCTEDLILRIKKKNIMKDFFLKKFMKPLKNKFRWGSNKYYKKSGMLGIHPTYVQTMMTNKIYSKSKIEKILIYLKDKEIRKQFSIKNLEIANKSK